jgi:tetratricopeptide (TPR) repeat protein
MIAFSAATASLADGGGTAQPGIAQSSVGPASREEAELLWNDGKAAFDERRYGDAAHALQRLVDRYPALPGYTRAHLLLGRARMELGQSARALAPLKHFVGANSRSLEAAEARASLARVYLSLGKPHEALLTATETLKLKKPPLPPELRVDALLLKSQALIGLGKDLRARQALDSARAELAAAARLQPVPNATALEGHASWLGLALKTRSCARYPGPGSMNEAQAREQMDRRGSCLLEASLLYRDTLRPGDVRWADQATRDMSIAFRAYARACAEPPPPPGKRSKEQLGRYRAELVQLLEADCRARYSRALDLLRSWKPELASGPMREQLEQLAHAVAELQAPPR